MGDRKVPRPVDRTQVKPPPPPAPPARRPLGAGLVRADRELAEWIDGELEFYVKGFIADSDFMILRRNLMRIAQAERRRRG